MYKSDNSLFIYISIDVFWESCKTFPERSNISLVGCFPQVPYSLLLFGWIWGAITIKHYLIKLYDCWFLKELSWFLHTDVFPEALMKFLLLITSQWVSVGFWHRKSYHLPITVWLLLSSPYSFFPPFPVLLACLGPSPKTFTWSSQMDKTKVFSNACLDY